MAGVECPEADAKDRLLAAVAFRLLVITRIRSRAECGCHWL